MIIRIDTFPPVREKVAYEEAQAIVEQQRIAAEVGRLIAKLSENCQNDVFANGKNEVNGNWVDDLAKISENCEQADNCESQNSVSSQWIDDLAKNTGTPNIR